jgi:hypothetical protein
MMRNNSENVSELTLEDRAEMALKTAVKKLKLDHARRGLPLYIWQDGKVVEVSAEQLKVELGLNDDPTI